MKNQNLDAYANGARFYLETSERGEFANSRSEAEKKRKQLRDSGNNVSLYYLLPDGELRICAKGKHTSGAASTSEGGGQAQ